VQEYFIEGIKKRASVMQACSVSRNFLRVLQRAFTHGYLLNFNGVGHCQNERMLGLRETNSTIVYI
jgi:hypothetical protein